MGEREGNGSAGRTDGIRGERGSWRRPRVGRASTAVAVVAAVAQLGAVAGARANVPQTTQAVMGDWIYEIKYDVTTGPGLLHPDSPDGSVPFGWSVLGAVKAGAMAVTIDGELENTGIIFFATSLGAEGYREFRKLECWTYAGDGWGDASAHLELFETNHSGAAGRATDDVIKFTESVGQAEFALHLETTVQMVTLEGDKKIVLDSKEYFQGWSTSDSPEWTMDVGGNGFEVGITGGSVSPGSAHYVVFSSGEEKIGTIDATFVERDRRHFGQVRLYGQRVPFLWPVLYTTPKVVISASHAFKRNSVTVG